MIEHPPIGVQNEEIYVLITKIQENGLLKKVQDEYLYWDKIKYKADDNSPGRLWYAVKMFRNLRSDRLKFGKYTFKYCLTDYLQSALHQFDMHSHEVINQQIGISSSEKAKFMLSSITEEAISSSQMEGANTTSKKAKEMILQQKKPKTKSEQMIMNNFITIKHIVENKNEEITPEKILKIHKLITSKTLQDPEDEGKFRADNEVYVVDHSNSEVVHTPPEEEELDQLIKDLCFFFNNDEQEFIHPIIKACTIHFMIGWIHPFSDGNGRTARALFYWFMLKKGYWLCEYLSISRIIKDSKSQYEKAYLYTETDENDLSYFLTYHLKVIEKAFEALQKYIDNQQKEVFQATKFMRIPGVNERMAQIIKIIHDDAQKILNSKEIESRFKVSNFTARIDLKTLVEMGFLEVIQVNKKKQNFIKSTDFDNIVGQCK